MRKAVKVRLYPTKTQKQLLAQQFGCSRFWWNKALSLQYEHRSEKGRWLKRTELNAMLPGLKKELSRRQKGSNRRNKARRLVARVHEKLSNARQDFLHKLSRRITDESQVVVVENLNIKGMVKNRKLSKAITQSGWGMFLNFLDYKLKQKGGVLAEIDRFFPSSQLCSNCGHKYQDLQLCEREWTCSACNTKHSRDENAAKNMRLEGIRIIGLGHSPHGDGVRLQACSEATVGEVSTISVV